MRSSSWVSSARPVIRRLPARFFTARSLEAVTSAGNMAGGIETVPKETSLYTSVAAAVQPFAGGRRASRRGTDAADHAGM